MKKIRLKDEYYWCGGNEYIEIEDEIFEVFLETIRESDRYRKRKYRYNAVYSLDTGDSIESETVFRFETPDELYERKLTRNELYAALRLLPDILLERVIAYYFQNMTYSHIARIEGVSHTAVRLSIQCAIRSLSEKLKNIY